jgi:hypothetical protein
MTVIALSGHRRWMVQCPLLRAEQTSRFHNISYPNDVCPLLGGQGVHALRELKPRATQDRFTIQLLNHIHTNLAYLRILISRAATASDSADQLASLDERKTAGKDHQSWI